VGLFKLVLDTFQIGSISQICFTVAFRLFRAFFYWVYRASLAIVRARGANKKKRHCRTRVEETKGEWSTIKTKRRRIDKTMMIRDGEKQFPFSFFLRCE
jgi:hypothetical protein